MSVIRELNFDHIALAVILTSHAVVQVAIPMGPIRRFVGIPRYGDRDSIAVETGLVYWANGSEGFIARMYLENGVIEQLYARGGQRPEARARGDGGKKRKRRYY